MRKSFGENLKHFIKIGIRLILVVAIILAIYFSVYIIHFDQRLTFGKLEQITEMPFYNTSFIDKTIVNPGELLKVEQLESVPSGMLGWRILYRSTDKGGNAILASGLVATPKKRNNVDLPIISWAHPTTGIAQRCAPSVGFDPFDSIENLREIVYAGYTVVAADYSGMGVDGPPSFLIGNSEARTVLDSIRAVNQIKEVPASNNVFLWGHSQGGHASLFASQLAPSYAPELKIKGVAVAAPATNLTALIKADINTTGGVTIGSYAFHEYSRAYNENLDTILTPAAQQVSNRSASMCLFGQMKQLHSLTIPLIGNFLVADPATVQPWGELLQENTPIGPNKNIPVFIAQGEKDTLINPSVTQEYANTLRQRGINVTYLSLPNATHGTVALDASKELLRWFKVHSSN